MFSPLLSVGLAQSVSVSALRGNWWQNVLTAGFGALFTVQGYSCMHENECFVLCRDC